MTVKNIILAAAKLVGVGDSVASYLTESDASGEADANSLLDAFNCVENQIALDYLPLKAEEEIESETGAVRYDALSRGAVCILKVTDKWGNSLPYKLFPEYLKTQAGRLKITYSYAPKEKGLDDKTDFSLYLSKRLLSYGVAAEFCLKNGLFEDAAVWEHKYKDAIAAAYRARPQVRVKSRRWV